MNAPPESISGPTTPEQREQALNFSAAHSAEHIERLIGVYRDVLPAVAEHARAGAVPAGPLAPLFAAR